MIDLAAACDQAREIARRAGSLQKRHLGAADLSIDTKSTCIDLVTEIDKRSERIILEGLRACYPDHAVLSEEAGMASRASDYLWIVDPLDGTTNYAQGLPIFSVSIALQYKGETVMGVVYAPAVGQMFHAVKGGGSWLNGRRIRVSSKSELMECVLATGFPYDVHEHPVNNLEYFCALILRTRAVRRLGSAAYDLACVAAGKYDGFWELNLLRWDVAAGVLLVEEAGGRVESFRDDRNISIIAGNGHVCTEIRKIIDGVDRRGGGRN